MNLLGHVCGVATLTREVVAALAGFATKVVCTRKTTPLLRTLEKYAVRVGGGANHRFGLDDGVLIKDNHRVIAGSAVEAVRRARGHVGHMVKVEVEIEDLAELEGVLGLGVDAVLLDNMSIEQLREAVGIVAGRAVTEASGGITADRVVAVAETGVDLISIGRLTHSAPALDVSFEFSPRR
jgi:nicotinate-nucleotide pyrophosphorylase (carboxylating)